MKRPRILSYVLMLVAVAAMPAESRGEPAAPPPQATAIVLVAGGAYLLSVVAGAARQTASLQRSLNLPRPNPFSFNLIFLMLNL